MRGIMSFSVNNNAGVVGAFQVEKQPVYPTG
jgi:hypothetical protein